MFSKAKSTFSMAKEIEIHDAARHLSSETHFNEAECSAILKLHANLVAQDPMDRMQFRSVLFLALQISDTFILDRIFRVVDLNGNEVIDGDEFVRCLSIMMRGTIDELLSFSYDVYDVNGDRSLARDELFMCLDGSLRPGRGILEADEVKDGIKDVVEMIMRKLDVNADGQITFEDFRQAIYNDPLLVQCLGQCLPPQRRSRAILFLVTSDDKKLSNLLLEGANSTTAHSSNKHHRSKSELRVGRSTQQLKTSTSAVSKGALLSNIN
jgi:Ca2+-binding EF-hand superfamily protein